MNIELLIKQAQEITASGLPFMADKEKLEIEGTVLNSILTVDEYGYMEGINEETGTKEEYVVIALKEYPNNFIYGSSVVTQAFKMLESKFSSEQLKSIIEYGLTFKLSKQLSKNKRKYTKIEFFPN